jgi:hypothetical protein
MPRSWIVRTAAALTVPAIVLGTSSPALAGDTWVSLTNSYTGVAAMQHVDDGDKFRVHDQLKDGRGAKGYLYVFLSPAEKSLIATKYNGNGAGTYTEFEYDVLTGLTYSMIICSVTSSSDSSMSRCAPSGWSGKTFTE